MGELKVRLTFNEGTVRTVDFASFFAKYPHPQYSKYGEPKLFRKFSLDHGNIVWGKNWDLIFPIERLHRGAIS